jgi:hypothetical protein
LNEDLALPHGEEDEEVAAEFSLLVDQREKRGGQGEATVLEPRSGNKTKVRS